MARGVRPEQLSAPTPCTEFDVRTLINHWVLYSSYGLECRARRRAIPDDLSGRDFTATADWAEEYAAQLDRAVQAWAEPAVWEGEIDLGWSSVPASDVAGMLLAELALHGWDVAAATGQEFRISTAAATTIAEIIDSSAKEYRSYGMFVAAVEVADDAEPFVRAVAASGRNPQWATSIRA